MPRRRITPKRQSTALSLEWKSEDRRTLAAVSGKKIAAQTGVSTDVTDFILGTCRPPFATTARSYNQRMSPGEAPACAPANRRPKENLNKYASTQRKDAIDDFLSSQQSRTKQNGCTSIHKEGKSNKNTAKIFNSALDKNCRSWQSTAMDQMYDRNLWNNTLHNKKMPTGRYGCNSRGMSHSKSVASDIPGTNLENWSTKLPDYFCNSREGKSKSTSDLCSHSSFSGAQLPVQNPGEQVYPPNRLVHKYKSERQNYRHVTEDQ